MHGVSQKHYQKGFSGVISHGSIWFTSESHITASLLIKHINVFMCPWQAVHSSWLYKEKDESALQRLLYNLDKNFFLQSSAKLWLRIPMWSQQCEASECQCALVLNCTGCQILFDVDYKDYFCNLSFPPFISKGTTNSLIHYPKLWLLKNYPKVKECISSVLM